MVKIGENNLNSGKNVLNLLNIMHSLAGLIQCPLAVMISEVNSYIDNYRCGGDARSASTWGACNNSNLMGMREKLKTNLATDAPETKLSIRK